MNVRSQAVAMSTQAQNVANAVLRESYLWHPAFFLRRLTNKHSFFQCNFSPYSSPTKDCTFPHLNSWLIN